MYRALRPDDGGREKSREEIEIQTSTVKVCGGKREDPRSAGMAARGGGAYHKGDAPGVRNPYTRAKKPAAHAATTDPRARWSRGQKRRWWH